ncbi:TetR/AcrR family transcriptional regulator [Brachybacterium subflavum]|uniref:TetR/AcrR family transcriptional regulator n=1 Tax=Brachybacterium subflavum TaxID=2585206 RepID=UPI0012660FDD|nr:helix-turn-helix domain-containing protein [Brachybacterium subflavum]
MSPTSSSQSTSQGKVLSTADLRRPQVLSAALNEFGDGGYYGTTVADVGRAASISPAYVFKLFPSKELLFAAALEECYDQVIAALVLEADAVDEAGTAGDPPDPTTMLDRLGGAYAKLIGDRRLLMMQVHAQSVAGIPEIGRALREGLARITAFAKERSRGSDEDVQRFVAFGQLCHLLVTAEIENIPEPWARILDQGMRHPD